MAPNTNRHDELRYRSNLIQKPDLEPILQLKPLKKTKKSKKKSSKIVSTNGFLFIFTTIVISLLAYIAITNRKVEIRYIKEDEFYGHIAKVEDHIQGVHLHKVACHRPGYWRERSVNAEPQRCGTLVTDELITTDETIELRKMAAKVIYEIGDTNYYSRESLNLYWTNLHSLFKKGYPLSIFNETDFQLIKRASEAAKSTVSKTFGIPRESLYFTTIAQFTRYRPMTRYSQFRHVDKVRSQSLVVTSILWLSSYDTDFGGGRTAFLTGDDPKPFTPLLVEPKIGRFAAWTSGWENPHEVMQILWGERYALIFTFTVNPYLGEKDMDALRTWAFKLPENPFA